MVRILFIISILLLFTFSSKCNTIPPVDIITINKGFSLNAQDDTIIAYLARFSDLAQNERESDECIHKFAELRKYLLNSEGKRIDDMARAARVCGYYCYMTGKHVEALEYYSQALNYYDQQGLLESGIAAIPLSVMGMSYLALSRYDEGIESTIKSSKIIEEVHGAQSPRLLNNLITLSALHIFAFKYEEALEYSLRGLDIIDDSDQTHVQKFKLLLNAGISYKKRGDFATAELYFNSARESFFEFPGNTPESLILIYNSLGVTYSRKGDTPAAIKLYKDAIGYIELTDYKGLDASPVFTNLGHLLAEQGLLIEAEEYFKEGLAYSLENAGADADQHLIEKENLAYFYLNQAGKVGEASVLYNELYNNIESYSDPDLIVSVGRGYSKLLLLQEEFYKALDINSWLLSNLNLSDSKNQVFILADRASTYYSLYSKSDTLAYLEKSLVDSKRALTIVDSLKIDLSAEEGRLSITERFDYILRKALLASSRLYISTGREEYLEMALEYSERSKASTLLASTRESKAIKFHIPDSLAQNEKLYTKEINDYEKSLFEELSKENPDTTFIEITEEEQLKSLVKRDNLIKLFEERFPEYYNLKHNTSTINSGDITDYIRRNSNFVEYYLSDSLLYSFIINRKQSELIITKIDSGFFETVQRFRSDIISPVTEGGTRQQLARLKSDGYELYQILIEPLEEYFISDRLVIASDKILSYIPFEAIISDTASGTSLHYRNLAFLFKDYDMEYVYSATLLLENGRSGRHLKNRALVFAPEYNGSLEADSLLKSSEPDRATLYNIQGAREEAIYISNLLGGELYLSDEALESRFKSEAPDKRVIHLAMHTLLNESNPMYSTMVFSDKDISENGLLNTYELYDMEIQAGMVVLSSCNTGTGNIRSGEGVISLARGFMYAGAPSVVMSLWEVNDISGSELVKSFYKNLKKGLTKSTALRKAREKYLSDSNQMESHPYYWCSLVILGDDEAIYYNSAAYLGGIFIILLLAAVLIYRFKIRTPRTP